MARVFAEKPPPWYLLRRHMTGIGPLLLLWLSSMFEDATLGGGGKKGVWETGPHKFEKVRKLRPS